MLNILIISDEARQIASLFRSTGYAPDAAAPQPAGEAGAPVDAAPSGYDIAFLDLDAPGWQERLLDARHLICEHARGASCGPAACAA